MYSFIHDLNRIQEQIFILYCGTQKGRKLKKINFNKDKCQIFDSLSNHNKRKCS